MSNHAWLYETYVILTPGIPTGWAFNLNNTLPTVVFYVMALFGVGKYRESPVLILRFLLWAEILFLVFMSRTLDESGAVVEQITLSFFDTYKPYDVISTFPKRQSAYFLVSSIGLATFLPLILLCLSCDDWAKSKGAWARRCASSLWVLSPPVWGQLMEWFGEYVVFSSGMMF